MKVEIVETESIAELDRLINSCIQDRKIFDIKLATTVLSNERIRYTALIMLGE
jgi:hypothetical protein